MVKVAGWEQYLQTRMDLISMLDPWVGLTNAGQTSELVSSWREVTPNLSSIL